MKYNETFEDRKFRLYCRANALLLAMCCTNDKQQFEKLKHEQDRIYVAVRRMKSKRINCLKFLYKKLWDK